MGRRTRKNRNNTKKYKTGGINGNVKSIQLCENICSSIEDCQQKKYTLHHINQLFDNRINKYKKELRNSTSRKDTMLKEERIKTFLENEKILNNIKKSRNNQYLGDTDETINKLINKLDTPTRDTLLNSKKSEFNGTLLRINSILDLNRENAKRNNSLKTRKTKSHTSHISQLN